MRRSVCLSCQPASKRNGHVHIAHVAVVAVHILCCGLPILAALTGLAAGAGLLAAHDMLHGYESVLLAASILVVAIGGVVEWRRRKAGAPGLSPLFVASAACLLFNMAAFGAHVV